MANNRLILRKLVSPWLNPIGDITKNTVLTHDDVDNNFIYLRGEAILSAGFSGGNVIITKINGQQINVPVSGATNSFVTGGTYNINTSAVTLTRNDGVDITIAGLTDTVVTGFTYDNANSITLSQNQGEVDKVVLINTMSGLTINGTLSATTINSNSISATTISATTVNSNNILLSGTNINNIFQVIGGVGSGDTYTTGYTYDNANNFTISQNGQPDLVANISTMTGLTVNGTLSATTINSGSISATTVYATTVSATTVNATTVSATTVNATLVSATTVNATLVSATTVNSNNIILSGTNINQIFQTISGATGNTINLSTDNLIQDAEPRTYDMNSQLLTFKDGNVKITGSTFDDILTVEHGGGELFFGGANGTTSGAGGGSNLIHDTKFSVPSSTINCHRDFADNVGLCLINYTGAFGLNSYAVVENKDGVLYFISSAGNPIISRSGSDEFYWSTSGGSTEMALKSGVISEATWEGVVVKEGFGGTAQSAYTTGDILYASAPNTLSKLTAGSNGEVLQLNGGVPSWAVSPGLIASGNSFTTGTTVVGNSIYYDTNAILSAYTTDLSSIIANVSGDTYVTGFTYDNANNFTISQNEGQPDLVANISVMTGLTVNGTLSATTINSASISATSVTSTIVSATTVNSTTVSATTVNAGDILSGGTNLNQIFQTIAGGISGDTFTTGFTYDNANKLTISQNQGEADLDVLINTMTGLTVNGTLSATSVNSTIVSTTTINAGDILSGGTNLNQIFQVIGGASADTFTTGFTYDGSNNLTISQNEGQPDLVANISTMTGLTVNGTLSATTVDGATIMSGGTNLTSIFQTVGTGDANAIHDNVPNEITAIGEKTLVDNQDEFILEDSDDGFNKKSIKRINIVRPISNIQANPSTLTPNSDEHDQESITGLAQTLTINTPSGSPTNGQKLVIRIEGDATPRILDWTSGNYEPIGVTLPTGTTANKKIYVGCIYNSTDSTWDVVAVNIEA